MKKGLIILIFFLFFILFYVCNIDNIPSSIILLKDENINYNTLYGIKFNEVDYINTSTSFLGEARQKKVNVSLFGVNVKQINVTILPEVEVIPIGKLAGLKLYTSGILVVGINENITNTNEIREGDAIISINNKKVDSIDNLKSIVEESNGEELLVKYVRNNDEILVSTISPVKTEDNSYKLGLWVKEGATGVGTISFYNPETKKFAALGHGVYDKDTGELLNIEEGELLKSKVISISKGEYGTPGEIKGSLLEDEYLGSIDKNTDFGIYGSLKDSSIINQNKVKVASRSEIKLGKAYILCTLDDTGPKEYEIEIESIDLENNINNRSMKIRIKDNKLIDKTGGIVCGMSGCPILQNGKLIGVVTNVLVNDSEVGYGVFADLMLKEMIK